ncbi:hypothetical protein EIN_085250 [Entamoeba invadens IP1]|uniref:hypothetical protein n=1 Tax=Entamoeba invadens IP1 TaxID=370355 RepID=UPI0002C3FBBC|nr:hypothetical protein EIN_085250 [Entamoeba invadens IP1]ELP85303.1 hypothetical protein EIN_085250 [Entamoeba invadens IP1]|eukprot:XP_004184649.1 hypothetical protein EIN_085250 [Entamoeba invadens IP1]
MGIIITLFIILHCITALKYEGNECRCEDQISSHHCIKCSVSCHTQLVYDSSSRVPDISCFPDVEVQYCLENDPNNPAICIRCEKGYYLQSNECKECLSNCETCNATHCLSCKTDSAVTYFLSLDQTKCVDCSLSSNDIDCGRCPEGQVFKTKSSQCEKCNDNCAICDESLVCKQCVNKTYAKSQKCVPIENCEPAYTMEDHCEMCLPGYVLISPYCLSCESYVLNCWSGYFIGQSFKCVSCRQGYIKVGDLCKTLESQNCKEGSAELGCLECVEGYFFNSDKKCEQCDDVCATCVNEKTHCLSCKTGYYFDSNMTCIPKDINCQLTDQAGCKECANDITADVTSTGYFVPLGKQECELCLDKCRLCEDYKDHCTACVQDYVLKKQVTDGVTHKICVLKSENCTKTDMGYCTSCIEGFFIGGGVDDDQDCTKCDVSCGTCERSVECLTCAPGYFRPKEWANDSQFMLCKSQSEISMTCKSGTSGCEACFPGYYINVNDPKQYNCSECPSICKTCQWVESVSKPYCTSCLDDTQYVKNGGCAPCKELSHCAKCSEDKCSECEDGYSLDSGEVSCSKVNIALIVPLVVFGVIIIGIIIIGIVWIFWRRRVRKINEENDAIKPFKVTSDLELLLLGADNKNFPLKTDKWELTFGLKKNKAVVDQIYEEIVNIANTTNKQYFFEFHFTPSHRYELTIDPINATLNPRTAICISVKIKMACTASVSDVIGITAMDVHEQTKETAKFTIIVESDLSLKLDHTELKPMLPAIGEGAFGMVFRGTYRTRDVAIKKMKSRSLTEELEKEFNHEVSMLTQLRHTCVVELIGAVYTEGEIAIVTEFAEYGSLSRIWGKHDVSYLLKVKILEDVAFALSYLHQNQIIHRDVKGENVLVFSLNQFSTVCGKLTDFGTCRNISERSLSAKALTQGIGTPNYMSPECLRGTEGYGYPSDVYSYGVMMYETYCQRTAYDSTDPRFNQPWMIPQFVIEGNRLEKPEGCPDNYWDLMSKSWSQSQEDRPKFLDVVNTIESWGENIRGVMNTNKKKSRKGYKDGKTDDGSLKNTTSTSSLSSEGSKSQSLHPLVEQV